MVKAAGGIPRFIALKPVGLKLSQHFLTDISTSASVISTLHIRSRIFKKTTKQPLSSADWVFDRQELEGLFNEKTKGIIVNTPHNPVGKVFTLDELQFIANLAKKWNTLVVSDEVYEWIVYEPHKHIRIGTDS